MASKVYLCVAPDGSLELWQKYLTQETLHWRFTPHGNGWLFMPWFQPVFWGREVIDSWEE